MRGNEGGPFLNGSMTLFLDNAGSQPVAWSAISIPYFVQLDRISGSIPPQTRIAVEAELIVAVAQSLARGSYTELITLHNDTSPQADILITCTLAVDAAVNQSLLEPASNFASQGVASGPFAPHSTQYTLRNTVGSSLNWRASASEPWVSIQPSSGALSAGEFASVTVTIDEPATSALSVGVHPCVVEFEDTTTSTAMHSRDVDLHVLADASYGGWTLFPSSVDTRVIYVSSSDGNDLDNGFSTTSPKRTIAAGKALLRNGYPDWLLLKKGDTWDERLGEWGLSGRSAAERMVVSSYGTDDARPCLRTGNDSGLVSGVTPGPVHNLAIVGIRFHCNAYDGVLWTRAIECTNGGSNLLVEDCVCEGYNNGIVMMGLGPAIRQVDASIRRNIVIDSWTSSGNGGNGLFFADCDGLLIEENLIDNNGWTGAHPHSGFPGHNVYVQNLCTDVTVRRNIVSSTDGVHLRPGGTCEENLFLRNAIGITFGGGGFPEIEPNGVTGIVRRNVILDGSDYDTTPDQARGWGLSLAGNIAQATVEQNIVAHNVNGHAPVQAMFSIAKNGRGVENTVFSDNIFYAWGGSTAFQGPGAQTVKVQLVNNKFQNGVTADPLILHDQPNSTRGLSSANNWFDSMAPIDAWMQQGVTPLSLEEWKELVGDTTSVAQSAAFPDPNRTIATYHQSIAGQPTLQSFLAEARKQSKSYWRATYTASAVNTYIRAGFGL